MFLQAHDLGSRHLCSVSQRVTMFKAECAFSTAGVHQS